MRCAAKFANQTTPSWPTKPALAIAPLAITPTDENGERLPAFAPLATISAVSSGGTRTRSPIVIASGASSATVEMAPGPIDDSAQASRKTKRGISFASPRASRITRAASAPSVPLVSAIAKSSVTPASVRNSETGKPAITASGRMPAPYTPMSQANVIASHPTLMRDVIDTTRATTSASRERTAGVTSVEGLER